MVFQLILGIILVHDEDNFVRTLKLTVTYLSELVMSGYNTQEESLKTKK